MFERLVKLIIFKSLTSTKLFTNKKRTLTLLTTSFIALAGLIYTWTVCTELLDTKPRTNATNDNLSNDFFSLRLYFRDVTLNSPGLETFNSVKSCNKPSHSTITIFSRVSYLKILSWQGRNYVNGHLSLLLRNVNLS